MKKLTLSFSIVLILLSASLFRCSKEKDAGGQEQEISFTITVPDAKINSGTKGENGYSLSDAKKIVLTIQNADGSPTKYTSSEVAIYEMNGVFFSQKLMLKAGSYRLTDFLLLDANGNTIFASPLKGSYESQFVSHPLPIPFNIIEDINIPVIVEVLSTENQLPADFGLVSFHISPVNVIDFLITVADRDSDRLLSAKLTVSSGTYSRVQILDSLAANRVILKDSAGRDSYNLTVEKEGYFTYSHIYTKDSLKLFNSIGNSTPLLIELERNHTGGTVTDIENNVYKTVKIGDQWWMAENLKTTKYNDGTTIPNVVEDLAWVELTTPAYCWYDNDASTYKSTYGALYDWYVVNAGNLCPKNWHVPSYDEWNILINYLGGASVAGGKLKETGTEHWASPNIGATNSCDFTALAGGNRNPNATFSYAGTVAGYWWSSSESIGAGWYLLIEHTISYTGWNLNPKNDGFSVRCIKD